MKKILFSFAIMLFAVAAQAQIKMHSDGTITFQTLLNSTTQGVSIGPAPNCNAHFNGHVYFNKCSYFTTNAGAYQWVNSVLANDSHSAAWVISNQSWDSLNFYVYGKGDAYAKNHFTISNKINNNGAASKGNIEAIHGQEAIEVVSGLNGYYFPPEDEEIPELENNEFVVPEAVEAMYADFEKRSAGLAGNNVEEVFPEAVRTDPKNRLCIDYQAVVTILVEAVKEQQREIEELRGILEEHGLLK